ncbi:MAG: HEPN domain-containing protein [Lentisphaerales bacterium]|nr:MAG: HEPN domain-containing protein [Lentisphaerales bacterium]
MFHAARAALATRGRSARTHSGILRIFSKEFVKTGLIEAEYARVFSAEQEDREFCDYDASFRITKDTAQSRIQEANEFVERIERFLKER